MSSSATEEISPASVPTTGFARRCAEATRSVRAFFTGAGFPVFVLTATIAYELFLAAVVFFPESTTAWGGFAREFKQWCFNYDPRTGGMDWAAAWVMLIEPAFIGGITLFLWRNSLRGAGGWTRHLRPVSSGLVVAFLATGGLYLYGRPDADADAPLPFPGERIRTQIEPPAFNYVDQTGQPFAFEAARGRVLLVTGVYAMCSTTCPQILIETKALIDSLPADARAQLSTVAVSLNPEYDTAELMSMVTAASGFTHPEFRFLNGPVDGMHDVLTRLGFSRSRNPVTGAIDHANLFLIIDAEGKIAYRFTLDDRHRGWIREAVLALTRESISKPSPLASR